MPVVIHAPHHGAPGVAPAHDARKAGTPPSEPRWTLSMLVGAGVALILILACLALYLMRPAPAENGTDARLADLQRGAAARRAGQGDGSAAGVAGRIIGGESGRRAQEDLLRE